MCSLAPHSRPRCCLRPAFRRRRSARRFGACPRPERRMAPTWRRQTKPRFESRRRQESWAMVPRALITDKSKMHVVTPDLVAELCGLSLGLLLAAAASGFVLWLFGWRTHRFWVVLLTTVAAGVYGLQEGNALKTPP